MPSRDKNSFVRLPHNYFQYLDSIKGNPKRIIEKSYGRLDKFSYYENRLSRWKTIYYYSENKLLERKTNYYKNKIRGEWIYKYDLKENEISEIDNNGINKGKSIDKIIKYNKLGQIELIKEYFNNITTKELLYIDTLFSYSKNGDSVSYISIHPNYCKKDTSFDKIINVYNSFNKKYGELYYDINGKFRFKRNFIYDKYWSLIEINYSGTLKEEIKQY